MTGSKNGVVGTTEKLSDKNHNFHCIIHQKAFRGKILILNHVLKLVLSAVNFTCDQGLDHKQFACLLPFFVMWRLSTKICHITDMLVGCFVTRWRKLKEWIHCVRRSERTRKGWDWDYQLGSRSGPFYLNHNASTYMSWTHTSKEKQTTGTENINF
jgi:hypothetical protein